VVLNGVFKSCILTYNEHHPALVLTVMATTVPVRARMLPRAISFCLAKDQSGHHGTHLRRTTESITCSRQVDRNTTEEPGRLGRWEEVSYDMEYAYVPEGVTAASKARTVMCDAYPLESAMLDGLTYIKP
jgi:hypothetical protein